MSSPADNASHSFARKGVLLLSVALVVALVVISILQRPSPPTPKSNGDLIAYVRQDFYKPKSDEIYLVHTDGTGPVNLTRNNADDYSPTWSPDGRRIAFISERTGGRKYS